MGFIPTCIYSNISTYIHTYIHIRTTIYCPTAVTLLNSSSSSPPQPQKLFGNPNDENQQLWAVHNADYNAFHKRTVDRTELLGGKLYDASEIVVVLAVSALPELGNMNRLIIVAGIITKWAGVCVQ